MAQILDGMRAAIGDEKLDNDTLARMHGNDERVGVETVRRGTDLMYALFVRFRM